MWNCGGALNVTAPNPVTNREFTRRLAAVLHRPGFVFVPRFALKIILGEMAEAVLGSARVMPAVAEAAGFKFRYPDVVGGLRDLCERKSTG
jgi:NAD dependent epimerase/dehydratase family enzyme